MRPHGIVGAQDSLHSPFDVGHRRFDNLLRDRNGDTLIILQEVNGTSAGIFS